MTTWALQADGTAVIDSNLWFEGQRNYVQGSAMLTDLARKLPLLPTEILQLEPGQIIETAKFAREVGSNGRFIAGPWENFDEDLTAKAAMSLVLKADENPLGVLFFEDETRTIEDRFFDERGAALIERIDHTGAYAGTVQLKPLENDNDLLLAIVAGAKALHLEHLGPQAQVRFGFVNGFVLPADVGEVAPATLTIRAQELQRTDDKIATLNMVQIDSAVWSGLCQLCYFTHGLQVG